MLSATLFQGAANDKCNVVEATAEGVEVTGRKETGVLCADGCIGILRGCTRSTQLQHELCSKVGTLLKTNANVCRTDLSKRGRVGIEFNRKWDDEESLRVGDQHMPLGGEF